MSVHVPRHATLVCLSLCVLAVMAVIFGGCADTGSGSSTTVSTAPPDTGSSTTTPSIPQLSQWDRELAKTAKIENNLAVALQAEQAPENDPRRGIVAGLRARNLAIATRQALDSKDMEAADSSMLQLYQILNMSRGVATGTVAQTIESARAIINGIGAPSDAPDKAAPLLEQFITATAPLLDAATAATPSTTTT